MAGTDNGLRATGEGDPTAITDGGAAGEATGFGAAAAAADGLAATEADGLAAEAAGLGATEAAADAVVGFAAAGAAVGDAAGAEHPNASKRVAVVPTPPVIFKTRRIKSRRDSQPAL